MLYPDSEPGDRRAKRLKFFTIGSGTYLKKNLCLQPLYYGHVPLNNGDTF